MARQRLKEYTGQHREMILGQSENEHFAPSHAPPRVNKSASWILNPAVFPCLLSLLALCFFRTYETAAALSFILITMSPLFFLRSASLLYPPSEGAFLIAGSAALIGGAISVYLVVQGAGVSLADAITTEGLLTVISENISARYEDGISYGNGLILGCALAGFMVLSVRAKGTPFYAAGLILIIYSILTNEKWVLVLLGATALTGRALSGSRAYRSFVLKILKAVPVIIAVIWISMLARAQEVETVGDFSLKLVEYSLMGFEAFGARLLEGSFNYGLGQKTFAGPLDFIGLSIRDQGVWKDVYKTDWGETNIYTAFFYLVDDFGIFIPLIFNIAAVIFSSFSRSRLVQETITLFVCYSCFISFNLTIFVHNSVLLSILIVWAALIVAPRVLRIQHKDGSDSRTIPK